MRKIFTFLCAALMSVGMFALTPKGTDVWDDATKTLTVNGNPVSNAYIGVSDIENLVISDAVTSIGDNAFENCNGLKSVAFGSSLASIGKEAFASCIKLESVTLPASLESIGKSAFYTCGNLTEVTIPDGVTSIGQQAFYFCEKLTSVTIPNSVASIGGQAFLRCGGLTGIVVAAENPNYSSEDGVLFNKDKTTLIQYPGGKQGEYTIPNSVTSIGRLAFSMCSLLTSVEIPNSVEEIVDYAFQSCSGLTSVTIGNGVTSIGGYAFYYSSKLASVTINATTPPTLGGSALDKTAAALTIYVPAASVTDYKGAWTAYADKIVAAEPEPEPQETVVTITNNDFPGMDVSFTKDGVTVSADWIDNMQSGNLVAPGSFSTTLGNFTKIEVNAGEIGSLGEGWSGNSERQTWTGNASSVSFSGDISGLGHGITIMFTIEEPAPTTYTLQLVADPEKGSVAVTNSLGSDIIYNGNGNYTVKENTEVTILATPNEGYEFSGWLEGNVLCDFIDCGTALNTNDNPMTITMTADKAYMAVFEAAQPQETVVTITETDYVSGNTITKDGVTLTVHDITGVGSWYLEGPGTFTNTIGNFTKIEVTTVGGNVYIEGDGWTGDWDKKTWTGNAPTVSFTEDIFGKGEGFSIVCTIVPADETGIENIVLTEKAKKVVVNGMVYIVRDGKLFNVTGAQVR